MKYLHTVTWPDPNGTERKTTIASVLDEEEVRDVLNYNVQIISSKKIEGKKWDQ